MKWLRKILHRHRWEFVGGDWIKGHEGRASLTVRGCRCGLHQEMMHMKEFGMTFIEREWNEPLVAKYPKVKG